MSLSITICLSISAQNTGAGGELGPAVFLIAGQSNAVGFATYDGLGDYPAGVSEYNQAGETVTATTPLDHLSKPANTMGWSIEFADLWKAANPDRDLIFVPYAKGSTGFADGDWRVGDPLYDGAVAAANAALAANPGAVFEGILWHQGERDKDETALAYETWLQAMIAGMRSEITGAGSTTPFVLGEISDDVTPFATVNGVIRDVPNDVEYTASVASETLATYDGVHFNAASLRTMGGLYYDAYVAAQSPFAAPAISGLPTISGTEQDTRTLTATATSVTGNPTPTTSWQWERSGTPIAGATSSSYTLTADDVGETLTVVQTETNSQGSDTAESAATGVIASAPVTSTLFSTTQDATQTNRERTIVNIFDAADISGASDLEITFYGADMLRMFIGHQKGTAGDDRYNFDGTPTQVFFGGNAGITGGTISTETTSDVVTGFTHDGTRNLLIAFEGTNMDYQRSARNATLGSWIITTSGEADSLSRTGYANGTRTDGTLKIEGVLP